MSGYNADGPSALDVVDIPVESLLRVLGLHAALNYVQASALRGSTFENRGVLHVKGCLFIFFLIFMNINCQMTAENASENVIFIQWEVFHR